MPNFSVHPVGKTIRGIEKWMKPFMMGTTSSITMQNLGKIAQRAPAVVCAHQKSYRKSIFQNFFGAVVYRMDRSCAPMFRFFSVASDGATTERQI